MTIRIEGYIRRARVEMPCPEADATTPRLPEPDEFAGDGPRTTGFHQTPERPHVLLGSTYRIQAPGYEHPLYVTINDILLNEGTEHEAWRPFEVFINSGNPDQYQWIVALTRVMSVVLRKGGDISFLLAELKAIFDPRGGYRQCGGRFMPSITSELGQVVKQHLLATGVMALPQSAPRLDDGIRRERERWQRGAGRHTAVTRRPQVDGARPCGKCYDVAVILMDGCMTCLGCGDSKCG